MTVVAVTVMMIVLVMMNSEGQIEIGDECFFFISLKLLKEFSSDSDGWEPKILDAISFGPKDIHKQCP